MTLLISMVILLVLFIASGFFAGAETALFSLTRIEKKRMAERHPKLMVWVDRLLAQPGRTLVSLLTGNLLINTLATALATLIILRLWGPASLGFFMVLFTLVLILFAEVLPKTIAVSKNETVALLVAGPLHFFSILILPFQKLMRVVANFILSLLIVDGKEQVDKISEDEIKTLVTIGEEDGVLDRQERHMIHKLFELGDRQVKEVMTPRVDVVALDVEDDSEEHVALVRKYHFSHFPVCQESLDHILGVVSVQKLMLSQDRKLASQLQQPLFVPESKAIDDLLEEFRKTRNHFAICVDEFGGTAGIVTLEDILEEVFGELYDEYAKVENPIRPLGSQDYLVEAKVPLSDFNEYFLTELEAEDATTLAGFLLENLGEVPKRGKVFEIPQMRFQIHRAARQRIISVIVRPKK